MKRPRFIRGLSAVRTVELPRTFETVVKDTPPYGYIMGFCPRCGAQHEYKSFAAEDYKEDFVVLCVCKTVRILIPLAALKKSHLAVLEHIAKTEPICDYMDRKQIRDLAQRFRGDSVAMTRSFAFGFDGDRRSIFLDNTPLVNADGSANFAGVESADLPNVARSPFTVTEDANPEENQS